MDTGGSSNNCYTTTPLKSLKNEGNSLEVRPHLFNRNSNPYRTPTRHKFNNTAEVNFTKKNSFKSVIIEKMPIYSPPPKNISFVKNPFEHARLLKERLSQPICSPSLFKAVSSPAQNDDFTWSIEDISVLHPADIDENPSQDFNSWFSPITESEAQEAINRFFSNQVVGMESPIINELKKSTCKCATKEKPLMLDTWSQTGLTLPPVLPPEVEAVLSKYCNFNSNQRNQNEDDLNSSDSSNTSRKKLLFKTFDSPEPKSQFVGSVSTPLTSRPSSPDLSPISESSPMDISMKNKSAIRLFLANDVEMNEKENIMPKDWDFQGCSTPRPMAQSTDSAFGSM